jgi:pimeloyl-ACP methyl ester carboxylesterase
MAPVARRLSAGCGVLEPLQTATTLQGQVDELKTVLEEYGTLPMTLIGYSWGAWLSWITAAQYPALIAKLILVSSGPFDERYVPHLHKTRLERLSEEERIEFQEVIAELDDPLSCNADAALRRLGEVCGTTDSYAPVEQPEEKAENSACDGRLFQAVWTEAVEMRKTGALLALASRISCPVVAVHGEYDPHPAKGVYEPLNRELKNFHWIVLPRCGHTPWRERYAHEEFYAVLEAELGKNTF